MNLVLSFVTKSLSFSKTNMIIVLNDQNLLANAATDDQKHDRKKKILFSYDHTWFLLKWIKNILHILCLFIDLNSISRNNWKKLIDMIKDFDQFCYDQRRMRSRQMLINFQLTIEKAKEKRLKWKCREKKANYFMIVKSDFVHSKRKCLTKNNNHETINLVHSYVMN